MKIILQSILLLILACNCSIAQTKRIPKNLNQAVRFLKRDCPDSLISFFKNIPNDSIDELSYPSHGKYKTIYEWTSWDNDNSKIVQYLSSKGVNNFLYQREVITIAFKEYLNNNEFDEDEILKPFQKIEKQWANEDKIRYTTDSLRGNYIPLDLEDCFKQINTLWHDSTKVKFKNSSESQFIGSGHYGFGMWLRNNWQLGGGSRLSKYFNDLGIYNKDHMSGIIVYCYHNYLNNKELGLEKRIELIQVFRRKKKKADKLRKIEHFNEYKIGDTLLFTYYDGYVSKKQEDKEWDDICVAQGVIKERNEHKFMIKILLIEACDRKGIVVYDSKDYKEYNPETKKWQTPKKRVIRRMKKNNEEWFHYKSWKLKLDEEELEEELGEDE